MWKVTEMVEDRKKGENDTERQCVHHIWKFAELTEVTGHTNFIPLPTT